MGVEVHEYFRELVWLEEVVRLRNKTRIKVITEYGGVSAFLSLKDSLLQKRKINPEIKQALKSKEKDALLKYKSILSFLEERSDISLLTIFDDNYPTLLKEISNPPLYLYVEGSCLNLLSDTMFAVVGSRMVSPENRINIEKICTQIASSGLVITSGLAMGVDSIAHMSAVNLKKPTVAVLGCSIDLHSNNATLSVRKKILNENGTIVSPFHPGTQATRNTFPSRNRIISGLSLGVLVCEAKEKSGSLITAEYGLEQNKEVFALPNRIFNPAFSGSNNLIKNGQAKLTTSLSDILEELPENIKNRLLFTSKNRGEDKKELEFTTPEEKKIFEYIKENGKVQLDVLQHSLDLSSPVLLSKLLMLEMKQVLRKLPGNYYQLNV